MPRPDFPLPDGVKITRKTKDGGLVVWHSLGNINDPDGDAQSRREAAQILWAARKTGLRLTPTDGGSAARENGVTRQSVTYRPRDSQQGEAYRENRAVARRRDNDRTLGVWRN